MKQVLIFTSQKDPHVDHMVRVLEHRGRAEIVRLNTEEYPACAEQAHELDSVGWRGQISLTSSGRTVSMNRLESIWLRRPGHFSVDPSLPEGERRFASAQSGASLLGALASSGATWVNSIEADERASNKLHQLFAAQRCGLRIPETIVTDSTRNAQEFLTRHDWRCVYKPLVHPLMTLASSDRSARVGPTVLLSRQDADHLPMIRYAPVLLQRYVDKKFEVRVTIVDDEVFAGLIDSQNSAHGQIDYREAGGDVSIRATTLPAEVSSALLRLMKFFGLHYAAVDLVCDTSDNFWFLDLNPSGQYLFTEFAAPELEITDALAALLEGRRP